MRSIRELVNEKNLIREKVVSGVSFKPDEECRKFLAENYSYDLDTRLKPSEKICLTAIPDFTNGGTIEKIPIGAIAEKNSRACYEIYRRCDLPFCGIDVFSGDVTN